MYSFQDLLDMVEYEIHRLNWSSDHPSLYQPITYSLSTGGKRIRPVLALMVMDMLGSYPKYFVKQVLSLEVFHNFTLLHDDLMDGSDYRRNRPTVHKKWDANTAILSGDAMLIASYQLLAICNEKQLPSIMNLFSKTAMQVCEGQQLDMEFENLDKVTVEDYFEMIRLKTAVLLGASLCIGALLSDSEAKDADLLYDLGINLGMMFQIQDDYLDTYGDENIFGKPIGMDITNNKKTFLLIRTMEKVSSSDKANLIAWIQNKDGNIDEKIKYIKSMYSKLGVKEESEDLIKTYFFKSMQCLEQINVDTNRKTELTSLINLLSNRKI